MQTPSSSLAQRLAVVTGASAGIGKSIAECLVASGCEVILGARRLDKLNQIRHDLLKIHPAAKIHVQSLDVASDDSVSSFKEWVQQQAPKGIDVLINNAGLAKGIDPVATGSIIEWTEMINTNVLGVLRVTRAFLPQMIAHGRLADIVMINSIAGRVSYEGGAVYTATKHALGSITKTLRLELNGKPIRVISIDPGMVETEFSLVRLGNQEKADQVYRGMTPLNGQDIAECVSFALSRPPHVNIDEILVMPTDQASPTKLFRRI